MTLRGCTCPAYTFPHRYRSGKCTGWEAVEEVFRLHAPTNTEPCVSCSFHRERLGSHCCRLVTDGGDPLECPGISAYVKEITK